MEMTYLNYPACRTMYAKSGVNFEHLDSTCSVTLILPNDEEVMLALMLYLHHMLEFNLWKLSSASAFCLSEILEVAHCQSLTEDQKQLAPKCVDFLIEYQGLPLVRNDDLSAPHVSMYRLK